jgi:hypothetical protein
MSSLLPLIPSQTGIQGRVEYSIKNWLPAAAGMNG